MHAVFVGMTTYCVSNKHAVQPLIEAAKAIDRGDFSLANRLMKVASRVEYGDIFSPQDLQLAMEEARTRRGDIGIRNAECGMRNPPSLFELRRTVSECGHLFTPPTRKVP